MYFYILFMSLRSRYRWYQFGNRLQVFFLGLLLGVVLSGGFFLLKLDNYVKDFANKQFARLDKDGTQEADDQQGTVPDKKEPKKNDDNNNRQVVVVSDSTESDGTDMDTMDVAVTTPGDEDGIVVRKNELIGEKVVQLVNLDGVKTIDSIRSKEAGIQEEPGKSLTVEFWQSPLNSRGYKMSRNRLVLFGFGAEEQLTLYKLNNAFFMRSPGGVFRLENTADFRQMERVTDEALLSRLQ